MAGVSQTEVLEARGLGEAIDSLVVEALAAPQLDSLETLETFQAFAGYPGIRQADVGQVAKLP